MVEIKRGDIFLVNLEPVKGSEKNFTLLQNNSHQMQRVKFFQGGIRPVLIIQNDNGNKYSPLTIIAPLTSKEFTKEFPTNVIISKQESKLNQISTILLNQIKTIDKSRIIRKISSLDSFLMNKVDMAIKISLGLD